MASQTVAVIGLGAAGAFTARAAYDMGYDVSVFYHGEAHLTSPGAFWLHWLPSTLDLEFKEYTIKVAGKGKPETYTKLQWQGYWHKGITSSFPTVPVLETGYNPLEVLPYLLPAEVKMEMLAYPMDDKDVLDVKRGFDYVFQTFPRKADIATQPERIPFVAAAKIGGSPYPVDQNVVIYNGTGQGIVVREAYLFGNHFLEFPKGLDVHAVEAKHDLDGFKTIVLKDLAPDTKPVSQPGGGVFLMGRYAQWDRRCLSHDCYQRTVDLLRGHHG